MQEIGHTIVVAREQLKQIVIDHYKTHFNYICKWKRKGLYISQIFLFYLLPFVKSFDVHLNCNRICNCSMIAGNIFISLSASIVPNDPSSFPHFSLQKSTSYVRYTWTLFCIYFPYLCMNGDISAPKIQNYLSNKWILTKRLTRVQIICE